MSLARLAEAIKPYGSLRREGKIIREARNLGDALGDFILQRNIHIGQIDPKRRFRFDPLDHALGAIEVNRILKLGKRKVEERNRHLIQQYFASTDRLGRDASDIESWIQEMKDLFLSQSPKHAKLIEKLSGKLKNSTQILGAIDAASFDLLTQIEVSIEWETQQAGYESVLVEALSD